MHHLYPLAKGDPLCPLGFHPQVRWPTRCKRCFRDYKEHGGKKKDDDSSLRRDDSTSSSPNLNSWGSIRSNEHRRSWSSSSNLAPEDSRNSNKNSTDFGSPASWTSTPDLANLEDGTQANIPTVNVTLPKRKQLPIDRAHRTVSDSFSLTTREKSPMFHKSDNLATRAKKLQAIKEASHERSRRIQVKELKASIDENTNHDVQFLIQVKSKSKQTKAVTVTDGTESEDDTISLAGTETTDTTLVGDQHDNELQEQIESMKEELDTMKSKCDRLEREKSDLLLRRLASMETTPSKTTATEVLKLQHKCNELQSQLEDLKDDKKSLTFRVKELQEDLETRPTAQAAQKMADELRSKLLAAETLCEELMDENEDMKKELRDVEEEMEELQDNFREDQANEYTSLKKELEQTTKNCRILSFKLRKTERKTEQLEVEKGETEKKLREVAGGLNNVDKIKQLEQDLKIANDASLRLQKELDESNNKLNKLEENSTKKKAPMLGNIPKVPSTEGKVSRDSLLTRGGSQDDPVQLLRDLQDSIEREADLREQLKFAEEEAQNLRKKASRIEDDNESLVLQLKKMATKAKSRKASPNRLTPEPFSEKDEGISEEDDPTELKLLLELNEQEASVLRKKVEELEVEKETHRKKIKELQDKLTAKATKKSLLSSVKMNDAHEQKIKFLEEEAIGLRKKLSDKEKEADRLNAELNLTQKRAKGTQKSKLFDVVDQQAVDLKRQLQIIEQEASVLRTKVQSLESENEKLASDNKRLQLIRGTKNIKSDKLGEKYIDKIAELEVELEYANKKIRELEEKSEKPLADTKLKPSEKADVEKLKLQISKVENERDKLSDTLKKLKEGAAKSFKDRSPKKPSDFTGKVQLKNMVNELENEIGEMLVVLNNYENTKSKLEDELKQLKSHTTNNELETTLKELEEVKKKVASVEKELQNEKSKITQEKGKYDDLNNTLTKTKENLSSNIEEKKQLHNELTTIKERNQNLTSERRKLEDEIDKLKSDMKKTAVKHDEFTTYKQLTESLKNDLSKKEKEYTNLKKDLEEKEKAVKELNTKNKKLEDLEKQLRESEEKIKKSEKQNKEHLKQLSTQLEEERDKIRFKDSEQTELSTKWSAERKVFDLQIDELNSKIKSLENIIVSKNTLIEQLEESVKKEREAHKYINTNVNNKEINALKDELNKNKAHLAEVESKLGTASKSKKTAEERLKKVENDFKKEKLVLERKAGELDIELQNEKKKIEVIKTNHEKEHKNREMELSTLRNKIKTMEMNSSTGNKKATEIRQEYQERIDKLEAALASEKQEYEDLTAKYEILEEEHVVIKAKLVMEKETLANQLISSKRELDNAETELDTLKDTYDSKTETLQKEKTQLQEKIKTLEKSIQKGSDSLNFEKGRLKSTIEEKLSELEQIKKEYDVMHDQLEYMRRENDDLKKKLDDYDKVSKIQRNISADSSAMEKEMRQLRTKLTHAEKGRKSDLAECKMRYDNQVVVINDEIRSLQGQVTRFKRERDTYKHMLEGAQKTIGDLKTTPSTRRESRASIASFDEIEESRSKIATLEQQISCMEDELSEARLEASKLKTELVSERSSWEIKLSELHSRVNELEEERILSSGRTKIPGLKTRMELAWHKEREEQQRLLQETSTLARDLRQTLFEVERERDKERLESKRKQEQLKKALEEDQEENRRKLTELQCDLLELRDAHAKLRTTNEKLRREKERHEREREEFRSLISGKKRTEQEDDRRINALLEQVDTLIRLAPELAAGSREGTVEKDAYTPTPPRRTRGPKSRESSPALESKDYNKESSATRDDRRGQIQSVMSRLTDVTSELRRYQRLNEENRDRERIKRSMGMRRATSTEHDNIPDSNKPTKEFVRNGNPTSSLHRRSLSLEHTIQQEQSIWRNDDDSMSSLQSIDGGSDIDARWSKRDTSLDSRLSGGSTQSDTGERKKTGLMGKLKKLTKSRSIDDQDPGHFSPTRTLSSKPSSNSDVNEESKGSKKDLRERITGIFKRAGSSSRSNSLERQRQDTSSTQRPLMPNGSNSNISRTSPAPEKVIKITTKTKTTKHK